LKPEPYDAEGLRVPAFDLPRSAALSAVARAAQAVTRASADKLAIPRPPDFNSARSYAEAVLDFRKKLDENLARPLSESIYEKYPVRIEKSQIAGVVVEVFTPSDGVDRDIVLLNLHGGAFCAGAKYIARVESIPICYLGRAKVVSIDYRQGFEHKFPAASEDVVAVYRALLQEYAPQNVGIYGGSAGGVIASQAVAWLIEHGVPPPGALGIFAAGVGGSGDSAFFSAIGSGIKPPLDLFADLLAGPVGYFSDAQAGDHLFNPNIASREFLSKYPPTLLITGTRAPDLSPAIATHRALVNAGVDASLHVFDGLGHSFYYNVALPESQDAYATILRFFFEKLVSRASGEAVV
jgi:acetyl esterase/lipase